LTRASGIIYPTRCPTTSYAKPPGGRSMQVTAFEDIFDIDTTSINSWPKTHRVGKPECKQYKRHTQLG